MSICLSVCLSVFILLLSLSLALSHTHSYTQHRQSVLQSGCLSIYPTVHYQSILPSIYHLTIHPSIHPSIHPTSILPSIYHLTIHPFIHPPIHPSIYPPTNHSSIHLSGHIFLYTFWLALYIDDNMYLLTHHPQYHPFHCLSTCQSV